MLTRGEVAAILGISVSSVRRLESNVLPAVVDESGTHLHSEKRVLAYKLQRAAAGVGSGGDAGVLASSAFECFDQGASPVDVVKELKVTPRAARDLLVEWADLRGGFVVSGAAAAKLQRLAWGCDEIDVKSGDDLVALLEQFEKTECASCHRRTPRLCLRCYSTRPPRAQSLLAAAVAASESRREERARADTEKQIVERARQRAGCGVRPPDDP